MWRSSVEIDAGATAVALKPICSTLIRPKLGPKQVKFELSHTGQLQLLKRLQRWNWILAFIPAIYNHGDPKDFADLTLWVMRPTASR